MTQLKLDPKIINFDYKNGLYKVPFASYYDSRLGRIRIPENIKEEFSVSINTGAVCFARIANDFRYHSGKKDTYDGIYGNSNTVDRTKLPIPNRIYYKIAEDGRSKPKLSQLDKHKWIRMCKENKLLPSYTPLSVAKTGKVVFDLEGLTPSLLYMHLSTLRNIGEYPGFVKGMVYLVTKLKMNFYIAFVFLSKVYITNLGHHIMVTGGYIDKRKAKVEKIKDIPVSLMIGLRRFVSNHSEYDNKKLFRYDGVCDWHAFNCSNKIMGASKVIYQATVQELFNKHLINAVMSSTDEEAIEHISERIREKYDKGE